MKNINFYLVLFVSLTFIACKRSDNNLNTNALVSINIEDIAYNGDKTLIANSKNAQEAGDSVFITQTRINDTLIAETHLVKEARLKNGLNNINKLAVDSIPVVRIPAYELYIYDKDDNLLEPPARNTPGINNTLTLTLGETYTFVVIAERIGVFNNPITPLLTPEKLSTAKVQESAKGLLYFKKKITLTDPETPLNVRFKPYFSSVRGRVYLDESIAGYISSLNLVELINPNKPVGVNVIDDSPIYGEELTTPNKLSVQQNNLNSIPTRQLTIYNTSTTTIGNTIITGPETTSGIMKVRNMELCTHFTTQSAGNYTRYNQTTIPDFEIQNLHFQPGYFYTMYIHIKSLPIGAGATNKTNVTQEWIYNPKDANAPF